MAAWKRCAEIVKLLLNAGAEPSATDKHIETPLHWATWKHRPETIKLRRDGTNTVRLLLEQGAEVSATDKEGDTPLHWAARHGSTEAISPLLEHGAKVKAASKRGSMPLHAAARRTKKKQRGGPSGSC